MRLHHLAEPKVGQFDFGVVIVRLVEQVFRLDVPVDDPVGVQVLQSDSPPLTDCHLALLFAQPQNVNAPLEGAFVAPDASADKRKSNGKKKTFSRVRNIFSPFDQLMQTYTTRQSSYLFRFLRRRVFESIFF